MHWGIITSTVRWGLSDVTINVPEIDFMPMYLAEVAELVALPD